jgi:hypothetical protein
LTAHKRQTGKFYNLENGAETPSDIGLKRGGRPAASAAAGAKYEAAGDAACWALSAKA